MTVAESVHVDTRRPIVDLRGPGRRSGPGVEGVRESH
jgi:hypothetical protein